MIKPLQRAAMALQKAMEKVSGATVTYSRAGQPVTIPQGQAGLCMVRGRSTFVSDDQAAGAEVEARSQDFIVPIGVLWLSGKLIMPQAGDLVTVQTQAPAGPGLNYCVPATETYEVMQPPYSPADSVGARLRIHTKKVS